MNQFPNPNSQIDINFRKTCVNMKNMARNDVDNPTLIFSSALEKLDDLTRVYFCCRLQCVKEQIETKNLLSFHQYLKERR